MSAINGRKEGCPRCFGFVSSFLFFSPVVSSPRRKGDSTVLRWRSSTERRVSLWLLSIKEIGVLCIGYSRRRRKPATSLSLWLPETKSVGDMSIRRLSETKESGEISLMVALGVFRKAVNGDISLLVALGYEGTRWLSLRRSMER